MSWLSRVMKENESLTITEEELRNAPNQPAIEDTRSTAERALHSTRTTLERMETRRDNLEAQIAQMQSELSEVNATISAFKSAHDQLVEFCASRDNLPRATNGNNH